MKDDMENPAVQSDFDLETFLPYLLNQAAEITSNAFQPAYKVPYAMSRTQWRVLANLGKFGTMTAHDICMRSHIEKTKVSRAVAILESGGMLKRDPSLQDRRAENLSLTDQGTAVFLKLGQQAKAFQDFLRHQLGQDRAEALERLLRELVALGAIDGSSVRD